MKHKWITALGALLLAVTPLVGVPAPTAVAAPAPWTWVRVVEPVSIAANSYYSIRAICPAGYTAITGGLQLPQFSTIIRGAEYRLDDASGSSWFVAFENFSSSSGSASVVAECARTSDLPPISHNLVEFDTGDGGFAGGTVSCLNPGEVVLTGGADWSNVNTRTLYENGPGWNGESWRAEGRNYASGGARLGVEVYCVAPAAVPGYTRVEHAQGGDDYWRTTIACPLGTRILNGGTEAGFTNGSSPTLNTWTATGAETGTTYLRAWCVNAGTPTIQFAAPPVTLSKSPFPQFFLFGTDPAGFPNGFRCSLDGSVASGCPASPNPQFGPLESGSHTLVAYNQTGDGRTSPILTHSFFVDATLPTATPPKVPKVSLGGPARVIWTATDAHTGIRDYDAAYWKAGADGSTSGWTRPIEWEQLATPSVRLPALAAGESLCISVRASDDVGNFAPWTAPRCTFRPYDDRALRASTGWNRGTGDQYWKDTITTTTGAAKTLRRLDAHLSQVGVVATVCPSCGKVEVAVGGTKIRQVTLERTTTTHQKVLLLPAFAGTTGTVSITSVTTGKLIRIDGLITARTTDTVPPT